jgi:hypothetical protein
MKKLTQQPWFSHIIALVIGLGLIIAYMNPMLSGKVLKQHDVKQWQASYNEIHTFQESSGERTFWTNSIFSGMPTYLIGPTYHKNFTTSISNLLAKILPNPLDTLFLLFVCFYIMLLAFEVGAWWAVAGALAFMLSTFNFINIDAGHVGKGNAIAFMPLVIAGVHLTLHKNIWLGALLTGIAMSFQLTAGHLQITYYLMMLVMVWMIAEVYAAVKEKRIKQMVLAGVIMAITTALGIGTNATNLMATNEYGKYSIRGVSELTQTAQGNNYNEIKSSGLDKDYALQWSNGTAEPFTLIIPNFYGGANVGDPHTHDILTKHYKANNFSMAKELAQGAPAYFGEQPFTAGPIYYGAVVCFLFVLGLLIIKSPLKWWVLSISALAIMLSMGKNFMSLTDLFFYNFPLYNKFRSVTFILSITQTTFPMLAILAVKEFLSGKIVASELKQKLLYTLGIVGGVCGIFVLIPGLVSVSSMMDEQMINARYPMELIYSGREKLRQMDALRSLVFVLLTFGMLWLIMIKKITHQVGAIALIALVTLDLWGVNKRFLNDQDFEKKRKNIADYFSKSVADEIILQDKDPHYRVFNTTQRLDQDAITSFWHKSIGGYHGAKMRRYQDLIEYHLAKGNPETYNMLNVKYFILADSSRQNLIPQQNPNANGNAWFVENVRWVANADEEIAALTDIDTRAEMLVDERFKPLFNSFEPILDSNARIKLVSYAPNKLVYEFTVETPQLAAFSEIYYENGWVAEVDNQPLDYFRCNYILRGAILPAGTHTLTFTFNPDVVSTGEQISFISSILLYGGLIFGGGWFWVRRRKDEKAQ